MKKEFSITLVIVLFMFASGILQANQTLCIISIPKCGTNLVEKCVYSLTGKTGAYSGNPTITKETLHQNPENILVSHSYYSKKDADFVITNNLVGIFIYRDPRDHIISYIHYVKKTPSHFLYAVFVNKPFDELIYECIDMLPAEYTNRLQWITCPAVYTTTFEKLIGAQGGGSDEQQVAEIKNIARHLNVPITDTKIKEIAQSLFGGTGTFREGKIGSWKQYFTDDHKRYFKEHANQLLIDLGYEHDANW